MHTHANPVLCDGCGLPASPNHIAQRLARLERATRFRPVHMNILFVAPAPMPRPEDDFYGPPQSNHLFDLLLEALDIGLPAGDKMAHLSEFQRKGCYMTYLSECPLPEKFGGDAAAIPTLGPALIRRIRFNYKPRHIVLLGASLAPIVETLQQSGLGPLLLLDRGSPLSLLVTADLSSSAGLRTALRTALSTGATPDNRLSDCDRMQSNQA